VLHVLQHLLETIYDARSGHDVRDYLVTQRAQLPAERRILAAEEELLLVEQQRAAFVLLYIDSAVLSRLDARSPLSTLNDGNIADFWIALEGVSHFACLMWNAGYTRGISLLDLELQAEVDKYVASYWLLRRQDPIRRPLELHHTLFSRTRVDASLSRPRQQLYATATHYGARFCNTLQALLMSNRLTQRRKAIAMLRRFYRLSSAGKLRYIDALAAS
jgi:hypothetical protein